MNNLDYFFIPHSFLFVALWITNLEARENSEYKWENQLFKLVWGQVNRWPEQGWRFFLSCMFCVSRLEFMKTEHVPCVFWVILAYIKSAWVNQRTPSAACVCVIYCHSRITKWAIWWLQGRTGVFYAETCTHQLANISIDVDWKDQRKTT